MRQVVGAAIIRDGRVLAARRTSPTRSAGQWEFPGGKVEPGETSTAALVREIEEELGCLIEVRDWLPESVALNAQLTLNIAQARLLSGQPVVGPDHDDLRWLGCDELDEVPWLPADVAFLHNVRELLVADSEQPAALLRGIVFDEGEAAAVATELRNGGYQADVVRERLAGEDDDEAHPWAVVTDAPAIMLEVLIDRFDGWLDLVEPSTPTLPPLILPAAPKRSHRFSG